MKLEDIKPTDKLFVVFYKVKGSIMTGSYLVNAKHMLDAKNIVKVLNPEEYVRIKVFSLKKGIEEEFSMDIEDFLENVKKPAPGKATHLEAGT